MDSDSVYSGRIGGSKEADLSSQKPSRFQSHQARNSVLTGLPSCYYSNPNSAEMLEIEHFQTIYNIFVAVLMLSFCNILFSNYLEEGTVLKFDVLLWAFGHVDQACEFFSCVCNNFLFSTLLGLVHVSFCVDCILSSSICM